jgi:hypothetical protein
VSATAALSTLPRQGIIDADANISFRKVVFGVRFRPGMEGSGLREKKAPGL